MDLVFHHWVKVLVYLYNHQHNNADVTMWSIGRELNISSISSIVHTLQLFGKKGLLKIEKKGRNNTYILTPKGIRIAESLNKVIVELK